MSFPRGLRAVVTGGGSGLGEAFCERLALAEARVMVTDISLERAEAVAERLRGRGAEAHALQVDVASAEQVDALPDRARAEWGGTDLVVNNAGVAVAGPFEELKLEDWRWIVDINFWGVMYGCRAFLPAFKRQGSGYVINVASAAGLLSFPDMSPYNATKAAVVALSETLYAEYLKHGVNVTVLCPTFFRTRIMEAARGADSVGMRQDAVGKMMDRSKLQAPEVAQFALDAVESGRLYATPMRDGRMMWRLWRAAPERFQHALADSTDWLRKWLG